MQQDIAGKLLIRVSLTMTVRDFEWRITHSA